MDRAFALLEAESFLFRGRLSMPMTEFHKSLGQAREGVFALLNSLMRKSDKAPSRKPGVGGFDWAVWPPAAA